MDRALHHQQLGDVIVDGQDGGDLALAVADIDCGGLEDLAVRRPGQITEVVPGLRVVGLQLLHHHVGGAVPHLPAGDVAVLDGHDGVVRVAAQVVDHHLAVGAELGGDPRRHLLEQIQFPAFDVLHPPFAERSYAGCSYSFDKNIIP